MRLAIMQPYFLPYIGYWQLLNYVDKFVILDDVSYIKKGWVNRNNILLNNQKHLFTIPLLKSSQNKLINEIMLVADQTKIIRLVEAAYKKAPCFDKTIELIKHIFEFKDKNLARFIGNSIALVADYIHINTELVFSSDLEKDTTLVGQERIIHICELLNASEYINLFGGVGLYNKCDFNSKDIDLFFIKAQPIHYKQFGNEFIPNLSILDIMMFNEAEYINNFLD